MILLLLNVVEHFSQAQDEESQASGYEDFMNTVSDNCSFYVLDNLFTSHVFSFFGGPFSWIQGEDYFVFFFSVFLRVLRKKI